MESAVFSPEEEPDRSDDEAGADEGEKCLDTFVIDGIGRNGAGCRVWSGG